ncbi:carboxylesterase/lipase family protein [Anaerocolumna sp. MB42-C2]|uniref:carboxylesterase/lipase family protein n=1 Tax=Anaerocolumna sp. MB42-C2 TaxID=3070997 RepID=UPI0027E1D087|nr:carboxylesterase family protein [Anaerocolumna sp. MB42-C2]WMJ86565.1 carboxylesterase family protein [Anaerocolumna sp. MB42-C2]
MLRLVKTENGVIQGLPAADPRITGFKGIPFAAPPTGENRFRAPQPAKSWEGILKAFEFAPISMQATPGINKEDIYTREWAVDPDIPMNEDCLYLNVWTPALKADEKLPVFVWYFGGGLQVGNTAEMEFDGERIARRGIVVVTINYRLNVFGFLCHPEITAETPEAPGNFGHLDQQFGTRWVKRNIASFGGDPDNITIGGQSAGGASVMSQLTSPQNKGLFQKAIIESGMITGLYPDDFVFGERKELLEEEQEGVKFFEFLGVSSLKEARKLDAEYINKKAQEYNRFWGTVVDNKFCLGNPFELVARNKGMSIPMMFGHTSSEFYCEPKADTISEFHKMAVELFGEDAEEFMSLCNAASGNLVEMKSRASVRIIEYANRIAACANDNSKVKAPMYYYNFDAEIPGFDNPGTFHSVDLWFFFETLAKCLRPFIGKHYDLARQMCNYWANFIRSGNPNGKDATGEDMPLWEPYSKEAPFGMVFGEKPEFVREQPGEVMQFLVRKYFRNKDIRF